MSADPLKMNLEKCFLPKINKSSGCDNVNFNIVNQCFLVLHEPWKYFFVISLKSGIFPNSLKITRVTTPLFEYGDPKSIRNYICSFLFFQYSRAHYL